ncbi:O-acyltransferase WSD1 [Trifolium repens]|nr:O-acyltransferase WSD1 [Trifolium repens]
MELNALDYFGEELNEPVSPTGQCLDNTSLCLYILAFLEFQVPIHHLPIVSLIEDAFLSIPHFTSIMVDDEKGVKRWKRVEVKLEEHITEPKFTDDGMQLSNVTFSMDHVKEIKSNLGVTINDVITGIIFYGIRLYMQNIDYKSRALNSTSLVIANTRHIKDYQKVQDMLKSTKGSWGNHITYYHVSVPKLQDMPISNPIQFVRKAHTSIKRQKNSFAPPLITKLLRMKNKLEGPEALAKHIHGTMRKSSLLISNVAGPHEQMAWANHPIGGFFFTLSGIPRSLVITVMSYMGMLRVTTATEEGFIDEQKLMRYLNSAFEIIRHESIAKENTS